MDSVELTKKNIIALTNAYKWAFPDEYKAVINQVRENRKKNYTKTGDVTHIKKTDYTERPIPDISELLFTILQRRLDEEEMMWWNTKEAARWFAKTFPEFSRVEKV